MESARVLADRAAEITRERAAVVEIVVDFSLASVSDNVLRAWVMMNNLRVPTVTDVTPMMVGPSSAYFMRRDNTLVVDLATMRTVAVYAGTTGGGVPTATGVYQAIDDVIARQGGDAGM